MLFAYWMNSVIDDRSTTWLPQSPILVKWIQFVGVGAAQLRMREVAVQDQLMGCLSALTELELVPRSGWRTSC